jgi:hypothetical protein
VCPNCSFQSRRSFHSHRSKTILYHSSKPITRAQSPDRISEKQGEVRTPNRNVWHGTEWSEQIQADWAEQFYTICRKPQIEAITWWDFADPAFIPHGGFLDTDFRPKQVYERLRRLLADWGHAA